MIRKNVQLFWMTTSDQKRFYETFLLVQDTGNKKYYLVDTTSNIVGWFIPALKNKVSYRAYEVEKKRLNQQVKPYREKWTREQNVALHKSKTGGNAVTLGVFMALGAMLSKIITSLAGQINNSLQVLEAGTLTLFTLIICVLLTVFGFWLTKKVIIQSDFQMLKKLNLVIFQYNL